MPLLNYTTEIDADKTCIALSFRILLNGKEISFRLPSDWKPVLEVLRQQKERGRNKDIRVNEVQAVRVAWRILKDWVEAQLALIETRMVTTAQVFLPYAVMKDGRTLAEHVESDPNFLLGPGK